MLFRSLNADGSFSYTPNAGFSGSDSFTYRVSDGSLESDEATVSVAVIGMSSCVPIATSGDGLLVCLGSHGPDQIQVALTQNGRVIGSPS